MKFLHCSDLHLGKKPSFGSEIFKNKRFDDYFYAFDRIIEQAKDNNVDAIFVAGDFFDKKETHPNILGNTENLLQKCKEYNIEVIVVEGNHDLIYKDKESESWIIYLVEKKLLKRPSKYHPIVINDIEIYGLGYPGASVDDELIEFANFCNENNKQNCILLVHTALGNNEFIGGFLKDKTVLDKVQDYVTYIAGGHSHRLDIYPKENPFFFVPGAPEYFDLGEIPTLKTVIIFDTDTKKYKIITQNPRNCIKKNIELKSINQNDFREEFNDFISSFEFTSEDIVMLKIKSTVGCFLPDIKWAENFILGKGALFAKVELEKDNFRIGSASVIRKSVEEIELEQIKKWEQWGKVAEMGAKALAEMRKCAANGHEDIGSIFDQILNSVMAGKDEN